MRLTGEQATDYSIASRTLLFEQRTRTWSERMLALAGLKAQQLPPPLPTGTPIGRLTPAALATWYGRLYEEAYRPLYGALSAIHHTLARLSPTR